MNYVDFYFSYIDNDVDHKIYLIRDPGQMPEAGSAAIETPFNAIRHHPSQKIEHDEKTGTYRVTAPLFHNGDVVEARMDINAKGDIEITDMN